MFIYTQDFFLFGLYSGESRGKTQKKLGDVVAPKGDESQDDVQLFCFSRAAVENHSFVIPNGRKKFLNVTVFLFCQHSPCSSLHSVWNSNARAKFENLKFSNSKFVSSWFVFMSLGYLIKVCLVNMFCCCLEVY